MKLFSKKYGQAYATQTVHFPLIGNATFDKNGLLEVDDEQAVKFIQLTEPSFDFKEYVRKGETGKIKKTKEELAEEKRNEELEKTLKDLEILTFEQLVELAKESEISLESLKGATDTKLRQVIAAKLVEK